MDITLQRTQSLEMPSAKRVKRQHAKRGGAIVRVPRAVSTRGTPSGYYEIPVRQLFRVYCNSSTGFWNTNQTTSAPIGLTGYSGLAIYATLDNTYINLGNGGVSATITRTVPDYSASTQLFDLCKIAKMGVQIWHTNPAREQGSSVGQYGSIESFWAEDSNDAVPPNTDEDILGRSKFMRVYPENSKVFKMDIKPHVVDDVASHDGAGTSTTTSLTVPSSYCRLDRPGCVHYGLKARAITPSDANANVTVMNILVTQVRRYKKNQ